LKAYSQHTGDTGPVVGRLAVSFAALYNSSASEWAINTQKLFATPLEIIDSDTPLQLRRQSILA
jgi:hypothetical protein